MREVPHTPVLPVLWSTANECTAEVKGVGDRREPVVLYVSSAELSGAEGVFTSWMPMYEGGMVRFHGELSCHECWEFPGNGEHGAACMEQAAETEGERGETSCEREAT